MPCEIRHFGLGGRESLETAVIISAVCEKIFSASFVPHLASGVSCRMMWTKDFDYLQIKFHTIGRKSLSFLICRY